MTSSYNISYRKYDSKPANARAYLKRFGECPQGFITFPTDDNSDAKVCVPYGTWQRDDSCSNNKSIKTFVTSNLYNVPNAGSLEGGLSRNEYGPATHYLAFPYPGRNNRSYPEPNRELNMNRDLYQQSEYIFNGTGIISPSKTYGIRNLYPISKELSKFRRTYKDTYCNSGTICSQRP